MKKYSIHRGEMTEQMTFKLFNKNIKNKKLGITPCRDFEKAIPIHLNPASKR